MVCPAKGCIGRYGGCGGATIGLLHRRALEGPLQRLVQPGSRSLVFLLRNAALFVFHFELKHFIFQGFEEQGGTARSRLPERLALRQFHIGGAEIGDSSAARAGRNVESAGGQYNPKSSQDVPAIFFQRIRRIDGRAQSSARTGIASRRGPSPAVASGSAALAVFPGLTQRTGTRNLESQRLAQFSVRCHLHRCTGFFRIRPGLEPAAWARRKLHGVRQHHHEMLSRVEGFGINAGLATVRQLETNLKQSLAWAQGENKGVSVLVLLRNWGRVDGLPSGCLGRRVRNPGAFGQIELEVLVVHLGARRVGSVVHREQACALQLVSLGLKAHDVGGDTDALNFFGYIEDLQLYGVRSRGRHAVIGDALVNGANQMRTCVGKFEAEVAARVCFGASRFLHPLAQFDQYDVISAGWLVGGSVLEGATKGLGGGGGQQEQGAKSNREARRAPDFYPAGAGSRAGARPDPS